MKELDKQKIRDLGLDPERIARHHAHILSVVKGSEDTTIPVVGACTTLNGGILSWDHLGGWTADAASLKGFDRMRDENRFWVSRHVVSLIPAAGAASRYLASLQKHVTKIHEKSALLREMMGSWLAGKPYRVLTPSERVTVLETLRAHEPSARLFTLPDSLMMQSFDTVQQVWGQLVIALERCLLEDGADGQVPGLSEPSRRSSPPEHEFDSLSLRTHWDRSATAHEEVALNEADIALLETETNLDDDPMGDHINWFDRLFRAGEGDNELTASTLVAIYAGAVALLHAFESLPKALIPTTTEGDTFLRLKLVEQVGLMPCLGNILVVPAGMKDKFEKEITTEGKALVGEMRNIFDLKHSPFAPQWLRDNPAERGRWVCLEQGNNLCSIRFNVDGSPFLEPDDSYSLVSAGHGELIHLFSEVAKTFKEAECIHIRNVDNVIGTGDEEIASLALLSDSFRLIRDAVDVLRVELTTLLDESKSRGSHLGAWRSTSAFEAIQFLARLIDDSLVNKVLSTVYRDDGSFVGLTPEAIHGLLGNLFHWPSLKANDETNAWNAVYQLLCRPLSVMGVVEKSASDVGGGPVFVRLAGGRISKLCMEMPHASKNDSERFFAADGAATHFNPVLAFFELRTHTRTGQPGKTVAFDQLFDDRFWLFSKKEYQGKPVCYHETVLYELIGNSSTSNLVFVEVPRSLFTPHKTIFESLGRDRGSYGFDEILGGTEETFGDEI